MFKKLLLTFTFSFLTLNSFNLFAIQDDRLDELPFDEEPLEEPTKNYFAIGGGVTTSFLFLNFDDANKFFQTKDGDKFVDLTSPIFMTGGQGFTGIPWIPNLRIGIQGMSGTSSVNYEITPTDKKQVDYNVSSLGLSLDYGFIVTKSLAILPGIGVNWGTTSIDYITNSADLDWNAPNPTINSYIAKMENNYLVIQPSVNVEWAALDYLMVRFAGGYSYQLNSGEWTFNKNDKVINAPSGLNVSAPYAQIGLFLGLFNY